MNDEYAAICGITEEEMLRDCREGIEELAEKMTGAYDDAVSALDTYCLGLPNREVSEGFFKDLLPKIGITFSPHTRNIDRWIIRTN